MKTQNICKSLICLTVMYLVPTCACLADIVTVSYSGTIFLSQVPGISDGSPFTGSFSYDSSLQPYFQSDYGFGPFSDFSGSSTLTFEVDGFDFSTSPGVASDVAVYLEGPPANQDVFGVNNQSAINNPVSYITNYQALPLDQMSNEFVWSAGTLQNGVLPNPFDASDVLTGFIPGYLTSAGLYFGDVSDPLGVEGLIDTVQVSSTPEPGGLVVTAAGCVFLAIALISRHRRKVALRR